MLDDITFRIQQWYHDLEFTAGGLFLYLAAFLIFILPISIFSIEYLLRRRRQKSPRLPAASKHLPIPQPIRVKELRIYPIKSCRGIVVPSARLLLTGLDLDRNWMFVDAVTMKMCTIRQLSILTLIDTALTPDDTLTVSVHGKPGIGFTIAAHPDQEWLESNCTLSSVNIWDQDHDGYIYPTALTEALSAFLSKDVRLVYKGGRPRGLPPQASPERLGRVGSTKFADFMPILVANQRSIEELNTRLTAISANPITIEHFRPNIIVDGSEPWYEDVWKTIRVGGRGPGNAVLDIVVRCARCQVPNVDPETGVKDKKQPWDTLMKYRRIDEGITFKPCFGMLCVPRVEGFVETGTLFEVLEVTEEHNWKGN